MNIVLLFLGVGSIVSIKNWEKVDYLSGDNAISEWIVYLVILLFGSAGWLGLLGFDAGDPNRIILLIEVIVGMFIIHFIGKLLR